MFGLFKKGPRKNTDVVFEKIKKALEMQGLVIDNIDEDGLLHVPKGELTLRISLDNIRKQYEQDKDDSCIDEFIKAMTSAFEPVPNWQTAKQNIFLSLFPNNYDFGDFVNYPITEKFHTIFIYSDDSKNTWIDYDQLKKWDISEKELVETAYQNMDFENLNATIETELFDEKKYAFIEVESDTLKTSLLLSKKLKEQVDSVLGWPVYAVLPTRGFCCIFSEEDSEFFFEKFGNIVIDEFKNSAYPITTEIIKIDDDGIKAIAEFQVE